MNFSFFLKRDKNSYKTLQENTEKSAIFLVRKEIPDTLHVMRQTVIKNG